jgi:hypothetical protein
MGRHKFTRGRKPSKTRCVFYQFVGPFDFDVDERLRRAERDGVVTTWDDGRGDVPWFEGPPGDRMRALKREFIAGGGLPYGKPFFSVGEREGWE